MAHTPTPWRYQEESDAYTHIIRGPSGEHLCQFAQDTTGKAEGDARLVVTAVNAHDALVAALEDCVKEIDDLDALAQQEHGSGQHYENETAIKARAALALAKGKP